MFFFPFPFLHVFFLLLTLYPTTPVTIHLRKRKTFSLFPELHFGPGDILQTCTDIAPGICCRIVTPSGNPQSFPFRRLYAATFSGLEPLDIAAVWALSKAPGQPANGRGVNGGCTGRVAATHHGAGIGGQWTFEADMQFAAANWGQQTVELLGAQVGILIDRVEGASYVRLPQCPGSNFSSTQGLKAFLGGGGQRFAPTASGSGASSTQGVDQRRGVNARAIAHSDCHMQEGDLEERGVRSWMWPSYIMVGDVMYTRRGGEHNLLYEDTLGEKLDMVAL